MTLPSINLELSKKLQDREYRQRFFLAESSSLIAKQLIELRKLRGLNQKQLAELAGTGQPAISRAERADYYNWSFNTLRRLAEAMDARIRVIIEPSEDVISAIERDERGSSVSQLSASDRSADAINPSGVVERSVINHNGQKLNELSSILSEGDRPWN